MHVSTHDYFISAKCIEELFKSKQEKNGYSHSTCFGLLIKNHAR